MKKLLPEDEELVRFAISRHNKKEIGPVADRRHLVFAQIIRDADKLDIYRVLSPFLTPDGAEKAPKFIASDASQLVSPDFIEDFKAGRQADYRKLRTHGDRKLVRLLWVYDIYFNWTLREIVKRGYIERIIRYLPDQPGMEEGVARLRTYVEKRCKEEDSAGI